MRRGAAPVKTNHATHAGDILGKKTSSGQSQAVKGLPMIGVGTGPKRESVTQVLQNFKDGNRDVNFAYNTVKEIEKDIP